ncbi:MAG: ABC transporter permease [Saprospiraceae bacterium]|nr:ABC transporter permease [Saprospiraceae bacterium]MBK8451130.1 ABC transporter permease [Saprospiraceae bacterium]MBK8483078.1 ABC transporter permease [Saprospiraceae bacterium]MBK9220609.1 ABC transporter permease [Saprospiraceae bacterium]MBK9722543.1 ABC transporter permease [Saprospiraceae bacterium]
MKILFNEVGEISRFAGRFFREFLFPPYEFREIIKQSFEIGYRSLSLVALTAFIIGLVITLQSRPTLVEFGAEAWLPSMVGISLIREIGPVITALICAGKIGSGIGAELGSMKVTEQIDAMEVSGTNPFKYIVVSRIISTTLMIPILIIIGDAIALYGSYLAVNVKGSVSYTLFFHQVFDSLQFSDVIPAFIKSFFFGFAIGLVGCYKGYNSRKGTEGVGRSANSAVVVASLCVFIVDLIAVQITEFLGFL